jgi:hypothetical protein
MVVIVFSFCFLSLSVSLFLSPFFISLIKNDASDKPVQFFVHVCQLLQHDSRIQ